MSKRSCQQVLPRMEQFWHDLYGKVYPIRSLPPPIIHGECGAKFHHINPEIEELRKAIPIYNGDWSISIRYVPKESFDGTFLAFIANCLYNEIGFPDISKNNGGRFILDQVQKNLHYPLDNDIRYFQRSLGSSCLPVEIFWVVTNFGMFVWDWNRLTIREMPNLDSRRFQGVNGTDPKGNIFLPRIFLDVSLGTTRGNVRHLLDLTLEKFGNLPDLAGGLPRVAISDLIR